MFTVERQGAVDVITGDGALNRENAEALANVLQQCLAIGQPMTVLDMQHVQLLDSCALELLLDVQEDFTIRGGTLKLAAPNPLCRDILGVTGVLHHFEVYPEVKAAVGSFLR